MPKSEVSGRRRHGQRRPAELPNAVEGRIAEICRDVAVQAKCLRQLQEQADELCAAIHQWVDHPADSDEPVHRAGRR